MRRYGASRSATVVDYILNPPVHFVTTVLCGTANVDEGVSGTQRRRPQLDALLRDAHRRLFDVVLVWKFDRFARSLKHLIDSLEEFRALGINFVSYTEGVDTTTPSGQLLFHVVGAVAQFERDLIAERVRAGMAHARAMGKRIGRPRAIVNVEKVALLRQEGQSLRAIAKQLDVPVSRVRRALIGHSASGQIPNREITGDSRSL